jgi:maltooligosyltrehalose trehalohydrolase
VPDPQSEQTFLDSKLDWSEPEQERHAALLRWTRDLIALRRAQPDLSDGRRDRVSVTCDESARWLVVRRGSLALSATCPPSARACRCRPAASGRPCSPASQGPPSAAGQVEVPGESAVVLRLLDPTA